MFSLIYKKIVIDFSKITLVFLSIIVGVSLYQAKNFNLDASSDALLLEGDPDLRYLREVNQTYGSKEFLVLTYTPVSSFTTKETILNLQLLKSKIEKNGFFLSGFFLRKKRRYLIVLLIVLKKKLYLNITILV